MFRYPQNLRTFAQLLNRNVRNNNRNIVFLPNDCSNCVNIRQNSSNVLKNCAMPAESGENSLTFPGSSAPADVATVFFPKRWQSGCIKINHVTPVCVCGCLWKTSRQWGSTKYNRIRGGRLGTDYPNFQSIFWGTVPGGGCICTNVSLRSNLDLT